MSRMNSPCRQEGFFFVQFQADLRCVQPLNRPDLSALNAKKTAPVETGAKLPWFSRVARAWLAALRRGGRWRVSSTSGEDGR